MKVLFYKIEQTNKEKEIKTILNELNIELVKVANQDVNQKIGHLVGLKDYNKQDVCELELNNEMMVLFDFDDQAIDKLLKAFRENDVPFIPLKAMVTSTNVDWSFAYLQKHIIEEYNSMKSGN